MINNSVTKKSVTNKIMTGVRRSRSEGHTPDSLIMNIDTLVLLGRECGLEFNIITINKKRVLQSDFGVSRRAAPTFVGLKLVGNDSLDTRTVLLSQKIGPPGDVIDEVVGQIDLKPELVKPAFPENLEKDTRINFAMLNNAGGYQFLRWDIPREAITNVRVEQRSIRTGYRNTWRANIGPYRVILELDGDVPRCTVAGKEAIMQQSLLCDDPAGELPSVVREPEDDMSYVRLAEK